MEPLPQMNNGNMDHELSRKNISSCRSMDILA